MRAYAYAILASSCAVGTAYATDPALEGQVTVSFQRTPLSLVIAQLQKQSETNLVLAPGVNGDAAVDLAATDRPLTEVLDALLASQKLTKTAWSGAWVIHPKGFELPAPVAVDGAGAKALKLPLSIDYRGENPATVLQRVEARTQVPVSLPARARVVLRRQGTVVTLRLYRLPAHQVLDHVALQAKLAWTLENGRVTVDLRAGTEGEGVDLSMDTKGQADVARLIERLRSDQVANRDAAARELVLAGKGCLPALAAAMRETAEDKRLSDPSCRAALRVMADLGDPAEAAAVVQVFKDSSRTGEVQVAAADALGAMGAVKAAPELVEALNDRASLRRAEAARRALVTIGEPVLPALLERYRAAVKGGKPQGLIYRTLLILGEIPGDQARAELVRAMKTEGRSQFSISIRHHAAIGLGMTGEPKVIPLLVAALEAEKDFLIAKYITRSLTWLTEEAFPPDPSAWRAWWEGEGKRKFGAGETAEELLKRLAGGTIELQKNEQGTAELDETPEARLKRLIPLLGDADAVKARAAENDLFAMGKAALEALRKASAGEGEVAKRAAALVERIEASLQE